MQPLLSRLRSVHDRMLQRAFPDDCHAPAKRVEHLHMAPVAIDIPLKFLPPELLVGPRSSCVATTCMPVPKTTVDEHHRPVLREHKVGGARQLAYMKSISKPSGEKKGAKRSFRPSVFSANARHHAAALRCGRDAHCLRGIPPEYLRKTAAPCVCQPIRVNEDSARGNVRKLSMRLIHEKSRGGD